MKSLRPLIPSPRSLGAMLALAAATGLTGCATTTVRTGRVHATAATQVPEIHMTAVVPPMITLNQLTAGGVREQRDDWTQTARAAARESLETMGPKKFVYLPEANLPPEILTEIAEVQALYRTVDLNLTMFGNPLMRMPTLAGRFDFSVGSVDHICEAIGADALLLVYGEDDYFTGDRKALVALGFVAAAFTGVYVAPGNGAEHLSAALIARDGTILWYDTLGTGQLADMRKPEGVRTTLATLLRSMPAGAATTK